MRARACALARAGEGVQRRRCTHEHGLDVVAQLAVQAKKLHQAVDLKLVARPHVRVQQRLAQRVGARANLGG